MGDDNDYGSDLVPEYSKEFFSLKAERWSHGQSKNRNVVWWGGDPIEEFSRCLIDASNYIDVAVKYKEIGHNVYREATNLLHSMFIMAKISGKNRNVGEDMNRRIIGITSGGNGCGSGFPIYDRNDNG